MKKIAFGIIAIAICVLKMSTAMAITATPTANGQTMNINNAQTTATTRVGVLDMRQIMERSTQFAQIRDRLQKSFQPKQQKLLATQNVLKLDADKLRRDNAIMSNNDRKQLEQKIIAGQQNLQRMQGAFQQEAMLEQNKALKAFLENIKTVVEKVAKAENLSLVITKDTVAYVSPTMEITDKVIQQIPHR